LREGRIHWSQPEVLLYDDHVPTRMSYPDLVEQHGKYWITETQKQVCRVHPIDPELLKGLWAQGESNKLTRAGLLLNAGERQLKQRSMRMPKLPNLADRSGFTLEFQVRFNDLSAGQILLDTRDASGKGLMVQTTDHPAVELVLSDGTRTNQWRCDAGLLTTNKTHHIGVIVDGGPHLITFAVDGVVCDGGFERQHGWGRLSPELAGINGERQVKIAPTLRGRLLTLRVYDRYLRNSEFVANHHASLRGW